MRVRRGLCLHQRATRRMHRGTDARKQRHGDGPRSATSRNHTVNAATPPTWPPADDTTTGPGTERRKRTGEEGSPGRPHAGTAQRGAPPLLAPTPRWRWVAAVPATGARRNGNDARPTDARAAAARGHRGRRWCGARHGRGARRAKRGTTRQRQRPRARAAVPPAAPPRHGVATVPAPHRPRDPRDPDGPRTRPHARWTLARAPRRRRGERERSERGRWRATRAGRQKTRALPRAGGAQKGGLGWPFTVDVPPNLPLVWLSHYIHCSGRSSGSARGCMPTLGAPERAAIATLLSAATLAEKLRLSTQQTTSTLP